MNREFVDICSCCFTIENTPLTADGFYDKYFSDDSVYDEIMKRSFIDRIESLSEKETQRRLRLRKK